MTDEVLAEDEFKGISLEEVDFLYESNLIERETSLEALEDAIRAWKYAKERMEDIHTDPIGYILKIHEILMKRLDPRIAGKFRTCDVWIGTDLKRYYGEYDLMAKVTDWSSWMDVVGNDLKRSAKAKEKLAMDGHVQFEGVHPFVDGNGRTGRILWQIHRMMLGLHIKTIEAATKFEEYYPLFKKAV